MSIQIVFLIRKFFLNFQFNLISHYYYMVKYLKFIQIKHFQ